MTRPNIAYVISQLVSASTIVHWIVILCILRYLRDTQFYFFLLSSMSSLDLRVYCYIDWNDNPNDRKSITVWCIFLWFSWNFIWYSNL